MTSPRYLRNAAHERKISLDLAAYHEGEAERKDGWEREDHLKAAKSCRDQAEEWRLIGMRQAATAKGGRR